MKKVLLIAFCVFVLVWMAATFSRTGASKSGEPTAANAAAVADFQKGVVAGLGKSNPKWSGLQVDEASGSNYKLVLIYGEMPTGQAEVERDTRRVAQAALHQLVKQGRKPAQEHIFVTARTSLKQAPLGRAWCAYSAARFTTTTTTRSSTRRRNRGLFRAQFWPPECAVDCVAG